MRVVPSAVAFFLASTSSTNAFVVTPTTKSSLSSQQQQRHTTSLLSSVSSQPPPLAPYTIWGEKYNDIVEVQNIAKNEQPLPEFGIEIDVNSINGMDEKEYFRNNRDEILNMMQNHGAIVFRNFNLMKTPAGFEEFYNILQMKPCLDPLHSVSARPTIDEKNKNSAVYEAVNKESRKNFFIGMHNEFVGIRAPRAAAFVCFESAPVGGEFLIADGRRIFRDLPTSLLQDLYNKQIRYSVMELPFFNWIDESIPSFLRTPVESIVQGLVSTAINAKVDFSVDLQWGKSDYGDDHAKMLQARAPTQPPIVPHPITGDPTWFCNVHSHSSYLRKQREEIYGAERFEDGASRINKSDMYFGDDTEITTEQLQILDEVTNKHIQYVKMQQGDVVLLDNYKTLHGRNVFDGKRKHAVCWFEGWKGEEQQKQQFNNIASLYNKQKDVKKDTVTA